MKKIFILINTILVAVVMVSAQDLDRFKNFQGIIQNEVHFYEGEGYTIFAQWLEAGLDEKGLKKIKKQYSIKESEFTVDSVVNQLNRVLLKNEQKGKVKVYSTYYLLPETEKITLVIGFLRATSRDKFLERYFVNSFLADKIPTYVYTIMEVHNVDFAGRELELGPVCHWMSPHNIQCPDLGQMNWAIFEYSTKAVEYRDAQYEINKSKTMVEISSEEWIYLKFEGKETRALKTKMKVKLPKFVLGGSNVLIGYYVTGKVRGKYVTCVLSHYSNDPNANKLPPLLSEVLELMD